MSLEAGSGSPNRVPEKIIETFRKHFFGTITVGGGIKTPNQIRSILAAGANIVTLGDILEKSEDIELLLMELNGEVGKVIV